MSRKTIAIDLDDVLTAGSLGFLEFSNLKWGTRLSIEDYTERWAIMWGVNLAEEKRRAHIIFESGVVKDFKPIDQAEQTLKKLAKTYKLVITTSRVRRIQQDSLEWLERHYQGIFKEVHFAGFYDELTPHSEKHTKAELCKEIGADYLIDDQPKHCIAAAEAGIKAVLFGDYPWNRDFTTSKDVTRAHNWKEVEDYFCGP